ncbi:mCG147433 [Mus musculus]|jgi:hypothetical protein|nr:mCG147433 [Mus musculus]
MYIRHCLGHFTCITSTLAEVATSTQTHRGALERSHLPKTQGEPYESCKRPSSPTLHACRETRRGCTGVPLERIFEKRLNAGSQTRCRTKCPRGFYIKDSAGDLGKGIWKGWGVEASY